MQHIKNYKKFLPSPGFFILLGTIIASVLFTKWALGPLNYEKAQILENKGHRCYKQREFKKALNFFLLSAKINDDDKDRSRRHRCVGTTYATIGDYEKAMQFFVKSLKLNSNNINAINGIRYILHKISVDNIGFFTEVLSSLENSILNKVFNNGFIYINRYQDGWSKGKIGGIIFYNNNKNNNIKINYFTSFPREKNLTVEIYINNQPYEKRNIKRGILYTTTINSKQLGLNVVILKINEVFNPFKFGISKDNRELGVNFSIKYINDK